MAEVYRFRTTKKLLGKKYQELATQSIYFAKPEELNDPMEGVRDIVWTGDRIVWANLFKHYVYCLHWTYINFILLGGQYEIPINGRWDEPITPQMGDLFDDIWNRIRDELRLSDLVYKIATMRRQVRRNELEFYFYTIHLRALTCIQKIYVECGLAPEAEQPLPKSLSGESILTNSNFLELMQQLEAEHVNFSEELFLLVVMDQTLSHKSTLRNVHSSNSERNAKLQRKRQLLFIDFISVYIDQLGELLWPEWYAACFMNSDHSSSVWGHYGDQHRGVCLIFEVVDSAGKHSLALKQSTGWSSDSSGQSKERWDFVPMSFVDVCYSKKPESTDFFRNIGRVPIPALMKLWYTDEEGTISECATHVTTGMGQASWRKKHWDNFERDITRKTEDWEYEKECRLILHGVLDGVLDKDHRTLTYDFNSLKGIIFGIRTSEKDKQKIVEIIRRKCQKNNRTDFKFFQAYYSPKHGDIRKCDYPP